jgi:hypothetical protein
MTLSLLSSAKLVVNNFPSMVRVEIQWNSVALISRCHNHDEIFFPEKDP